MGCSLGKLVELGSAASMNLFTLASVAIYLLIEPKACVHWGLIYAYPSAAKPLRFLSLYEGKLTLILVVV